MKKKQKKANVNKKSLWEKVVGKYGQDSTKYITDREAQPGRQRRTKKVKGCE